MDLDRELLDFVGREDHEQFSFNCIVFIYMTNLLTKYNRSTASFVSAMHRDISRMKKLLAHKEHFDVNKLTVAEVFLNDNRIDEAWAEMEDMYQDTLHAMGHGLFEEKDCYDINILICQKSIDILNVYLKRDAEDRNTILELQQEIKDDISKLRNEQEMNRLDLFKEFLKSFNSGSESE